VFSATRTVVLLRIVALPTIGAFPGGCDIDPGTFPYRRLLIVSLAMIPALQVWGQLPDHQAAQPIFEVDRDKTIREVMWTGVHPHTVVVPDEQKIQLISILDTQGLQSPASRTGLSTLPNLLPSPREKRWPITALELPEVNKPQARISGVGISIPLQYIYTHASRSLQVRLHLRFGLFPDRVLK
jgi:hypothetical protein